MKLLALILIGIILLWVYTLSLNRLTESATRPTYRLIKYTDKTLLMPEEMISSNSSTLYFFWATWCPSCKPELRSLVALAEKTKTKDFEVIAVNVDELTNIQEVKRYWEDLNISTKLVTIGEDKELMKSLDIDVLPTALLVLSNETVDFKIDGQMDWSQPAMQQLVFDKL